MEVRTENEQTGVKRREEKKLQQKINQELLYIETEENIIENPDFIAQTE